MTIVYKQRAANAINKVASFIENNNTEGSGIRWFSNLDEKMSSLAQLKVQLHCSNKALALRYYCFNFKGWVIAYRISGNKFEVCRLIWGARLK